MLGAVWILGVRILGDGVWIGGRGLGVFLGTFDAVVKLMFSVTNSLLIIQHHDPRPRNNVPQLTRTWGAEACRDAGGHGWVWAHMVVCTDSRYSTVTMNLSLQWGRGVECHRQNWKSQQEKEAVETQDP